MKINLQKQNVVLVQAGKPSEIMLQKNEVKIEVVKQEINVGLGYNSNAFATKEELKNVVYELDKNITYEILN